MSCAGRSVTGPRCERMFAATQSRQNSLPSMSCMTMHDSFSSSAGSSRTRTAPSATSRAHSASSAARRSSPTSPVPTRTSRCTRFLTTLPSGTRWKYSRGPTPVGSMHANDEPRCSGGSVRSKSSQVANPSGRRWYDVPQHLAPEASEALRVRAVERDLELLDRRHGSTVVDSSTPFSRHGSARHRAAR